ncbi:MAG: DUF5020 family protein [Bacteroidales bacterium]|nr:DUF5020 family protein [Bacteroidales bacterium]
MNKKSLLLTIAVLSFSLASVAQVNLQGFYDFGRKHVTTTLEMFKADNWGSTYFFTDIDYNYRNDRNLPVSASGAYLEFSRCLNFWQNSKASGLNIHLEFDAGLGIFKQSDTLNNVLNCGYPINNAALGGLNYCWHDADYKNVLNFQLLFKYIFDNMATVPLQFTFVWTCNDLFRAKGLQFAGFIDIWGQNQKYDLGNGKVDEQKFVILSEPQLWYNVGQWFHCDNLNIGGEVELSYNFAQEGFRCNPCLGLKWVF